jgi:hypothetical protein
MISAMVFADQAGFQRILQLVQVKHVGRGIFLLGIGQNGGAPVRGLLLLGHIDADHFRQQVFQPVAVGEGAHQLGRDLGTPHRGGDDAKRLLQHGDVEPAEVEQLQRRGVGQQALQVGGSGLALGDLHQMGIAVARGQLHQAQPVAARVEPHGFGVDGDDGAKVQAGGQVVLVKLDGHDGPI